MTHSLVKITCVNLWEQSLHIGSVWQRLDVNEAKSDTGKYDLSVQGMWPPSSVVSRMCSQFPSSRITAFWEWGLSIWIWSGHPGPRAPRMCLCVPPSTFLPACCCWNQLTPVTHQSSDIFHQDFSKGPHIPEKSILLYCHIVKILC